MSNEASELLSSPVLPETEDEEGGVACGQPRAELYINAARTGRASSCAAVALLPLLVAAAVLATGTGAGRQRFRDTPSASSAHFTPMAAYATYGGSGPFQCTGTAASLVPGQGDGSTWRCAGGACIQAAARCDGSPQCLDQSDERGCQLTDEDAGAAMAGGATGAAPAPMPAPAPAPAPPGSSSSNSISFPLASGWQPPPPPEPASPGYGCTERGGYVYEEVWRAQGTTFFDNFNFLLNDANSGAAQYLTREQAMQKKVTVANEDYAILRPGPTMNHLKRASAKLETKEKWTYFLMTAKLNHVPYGCGVWPAFWTHSPEAAWPDGGELDILEYSNEIASRSSFHCGLSNKCKLDPDELRKPGCPQYVDAEFNFTGDFQCVTHYPDMIGCAPNRLPLQSGEQMSAGPRVVAAEWTPSYIKVFSIPAAETPTDLAVGQPQPDNWDRWLMAYYPFGASERNRPGSCPNPGQVLKAQQLVLSLGFCGDWSSKVWLNSTCANTKGPSLPSECVAVDPHNPMGEIPGGPRDCCTAFISDEYGQYGTDEYLARQGHFNVSWIKVYQQSGH